MWSTTSSSSFLYTLYCILLNFMYTSKLSILLFIINQCVYSRKHKMGVSVFRIYTILQMNEKKKKRTNNYPLWWPILYLRARAFTINKSCPGTHTFSFLLLYILINKYDENYNNNNNNIILFSGCTATLYMCSIHTARVYWTKKKSIQDNLYQIQKEMNKKQRVSFRCVHGGRKKYAAHKYTMNKNAHNARLLSNRPPTFFCAAPTPSQSSSYATQHRYTHSLYKY